MAETTINGITGYVTHTSGTVTYFIRSAALSEGELDYIAARDAAKETTLKADLEALEYPPTGQNAWTRFSGYVEEYDSGTDLAEIRSGDIADAAAEPTQAEFNALVARVNALSNVVGSKK